MLLCCARRCVSASIGSLGTSFERLQGDLRAPSKALRVSLLLLGASLGALRERLWGLLEPLLGLLRKTLIFTALGALPRHPLGARRPRSIDIYDGLAPGRKPVRARTGSELLRGRMLSRGIEKRAATDSEQMRQ